jgi:hypothetical protein
LAVPSFIFAFFIMIYMRDTTGKTKEEIEEMFDDELKKKK